MIIGRDKIIQKIKTIYDPEIPVDVWELGLIYEIREYPIRNILIRMTLTSPNCPSAEVIPHMVKEAISEIEGVESVEVQLTFEPPYEQGMMSEIARLELGFF